MEQNVLIQDIHSSIFKEMNDKTIGATFSVCFITLNFVLFIKPKQVLQMLNQYHLNKCRTHISCSPFCISPITDEQTNCLSS